VQNRSVARLAVPVGVVGIVLMLVVPLPAALLDVLIVVNITGSLVVLAGWCVAGVLLAGCWYGAARLTAYAAARVTPHGADPLRRP